MSALTIRWLIHLFLIRRKKYCCGDKKQCKIYKQKYEEYRKTGLTLATRRYVECLIQAGFANVGSFCFSLIGVIIGTVLPVPGATVVCPIVLGIIGYVLLRLGSGAAVAQIKDMLGIKEMDESKFWCKCFPNEDVSSLTMVEDNNIDLKA